MPLAELWHFPRPALAKQYLKLLDSGMVTSTTIFAPRRTGKTQFLRKDLTPAALKAGFAVVYVDLWQTRDPGRALLAALEAALEPESLPGKVLAKLTPKVKALKASASVAGNKVEGDVQLDPGGAKAQSEVALLLDKVIGQLVKKKPLLLLADEAQVLASTSAGEDVARALRTAMTKHASGLRVVFTGSSRTKLAHVFSNANAPLFSAGSGIQEFPLLGEDFVESIVLRFKAASSRTLNYSAAWRAFQRFNQRPEPFVSVVVDLTLNPGVTMPAAVRAEEARLAEQENHDGVWESLDATEKLMVKAIAADAALKPFSQAFVVAMRKNLGVPRLSSAHLQKALGRLADKNVVVKTPRGTFEFEHEAFAAWVRNIAN